MSRVVYTFYGVHMGIAFRGMQDQMTAAGVELKPGETAVFINSRWTVAKILHPNNHIHYHRVKSGSLDVDQLRQMPTRLTPTKLNFGAGTAAVLKEHGRFLKDAAKALKQVRA